MINKEQKKDKNIFLLIFICSISCMILYHLQYISYEFYNLDILFLISGVCIIILLGFFLYPFKKMNYRKNKSI